MADLLSGYADAGDCSESMLRSVCRNPESNTKEWKGGLHSYETMDIRHRSDRRCQRTCAVEAVGVYHDRAGGEVSLPGFPEDRTLALESHIQT